MITPDEKRKMVREDERHLLHNQFLRIGLAVILLVPLTWVGVGLVSHSLRLREVERAVDAARKAMVAGNAVVALQHLDAALAADPASAEALELAGDLAKDHRPLEYLRLRMEFDKASPQSTTAKLKLARAAIEAGVTSVAANALARVPEEDKASPDYMSAEAAMLHRLGNPDAAISLLKRSIEAADDPIPHMVHLAEVMVEADKSEVDEYLEALSGRIAPSSPHYTAFLRILRDNHERHQRVEEACAQAMAVLEAGTSTEADRMLAMDMLCRSASEPADRQLVAVMSRAKDHAEIHRLAMRLLSFKPPSRLSALVPQLPEDFRNSAHFKAVEAACHAKSGDWVRLLALLGESGWDGLDYLHAAYAALAQRATNADSAWKARWSEAIRKAASRPESLDLLYLSVSAWPGWQDETTRALWKFVESGNQVTEALGHLDEHYRSLGDDGGLLRVVTAKLERAPDDLALRIEYARLCLLRRVRVEEAGRMAAESFAASPELPEAVITQAFALSTAARHEQAVSLMRSLPEVTLKNSNAAAYMAIILAAAGNNDEAAEFLQRVDPESLLAAERSLLPKAR